jgi:hypothetical protein
MTLNSLMVLTFDGWWTKNHWAALIDAKWHAQSIGLVSAPGVFVISYASLI